MTGKERRVSQYGTVVVNDNTYYRTRVKDADGKLVALYGDTCEELHGKVILAKRQIKDEVFRRDNPTVEEYCRKWLCMRSATIRSTTAA